MGDMYVFNMSRLLNYGKTHTKIIINPLSAQFSDSFFSKVPDSNHYDGIFSTKLTQDKKIITLSIDRKISFFSLKSAHPEVDDGEE